MGLRDAIDAGRKEIKTTAEQVFASLKIEEQIKQAVVLGYSSIYVGFYKSKNMHVIQQEVVRQISEEGFTVEWENSCCPNTELPPPEVGVEYPERVNCEECNAEIRSNPWPRFLFGHMTISWDSSNQNPSKNDFNKGSL